MQVLILIRGLELRRMKESKTIKEYLDKLFGIANKIHYWEMNFLIPELYKKRILQIYL